MEFKRASPVYPVADINASIEWYRSVFGFEPTYVNPGPDGPNYAVLYRNKTVSIHLLRQDEDEYGLTSPVQAQFWIDDELDELFGKVESMGVRVVEPPKDRPWEHRDFMVADPDGNLVWITTPLST